MEYVEGRDTSWAGHAVPLKVPDGIGYVIRIGEALQAAHAGGIVHLDKKSGNIMVTETGQVKVIKILIPHPNASQPISFVFSCIDYSV